MLYLYGKFPQSKDTEKIQLPNRRNIGNDKRKPSRMSERGKISLI